MASFSESFVSLGQAVVELCLVVHSVYFILNVFRSGMPIPKLPSQEGMVSCNYNRRPMSLCSIVHGWNAELWSKEVNETLPKFAMPAVLGIEGLSFF